MSDWDYDLHTFWNDHGCLIVLPDGRTLRTGQEFGLKSDPPLYLIFDQVEYPDEGGYVLVGVEINEQWEKRWDFTVDHIDRIAKFGGRLRRRADGTVAPSPHVSKANSAKILDRWAAHIAVNGPWRLTSRAALAEALNLQEIGLTKADVAKAVDAAGKDPRFVVTHADNTDQGPFGLRTFALDPKAVQL